MRMRMLKSAVVLGALTTVFSAKDVTASSHREAPFIAKNPKVDGTDFYLFRSYESGRSDFVTVVANYQPLQDAFGGPNFFTMDDQALYEIHIDNTGDAKEDLTFQFQFQNTLANNGNGIALPIGSGANQKTVGIALINAGSLTDATGAPVSMPPLNVIETYSVKLVTGNRRTGKAADITNAADGTKVFTKPTDNIGVKSFGNSLTAYAAFASRFIYDINIPGCATPGKVFVGQRAESFAVNLGPVFDLVNAPAAAVTGGNTLAGRSLVPDPLAAKNITTIALELPISCVKGSSDVIGGWQTASVRQARVINPNATFALPAKEGGAWAQVSRLGMPLVNELVIGLKDKDRWNSSEPKDDAQFADYVTNPTLPALLEVLFGAAGAVAPTAIPRNDLVRVFLQGWPGVNQFPSGFATAEMIRLNTAIPPTATGQNDLGAALCFVDGTTDPGFRVVSLTNDSGSADLGKCDPAGFPNGRRPGDDSVDIELRVAMGYLLGSDADAPSRNVGFTDAVAQNQGQFAAAFPYLQPPTPGATNTTP